MEWVWGWFSRVSNMRFLIDTVLDLARMLMCTCKPGYSAVHSNDDPSPSPRPAPAPSPKTTPTPNPPVAQPALTTTARQAPVVANPKPNPAPAPATSPRQVITLSIPSSVSSGITPSVEHAPSDSDVEAVSSDTISDHTDTPFSEADDEVATATETASKLGEVQQPASEISLAGTSTAGDEKDQSAKTSASTDDIKKTMTDSGWYVTSQDFALGSSPSDARISQSRTILWCSFVLLVVSVDVFL